jgi:hypothetical protein
MIHHRWVISCNYCRMEITRYRSVHCMMWHTVLLTRLPVLLYCHAVSLYQGICNLIDARNKKRGLPYSTQQYDCRFHRQNWKINEKNTVEVYLRPRISRYRPTTVSRSITFCIPNFFYKSDEVCVKRGRKSNFGTSNKYVFWCISIDISKGCYRLYKDNDKPNFAQFNE